MQTTLSFRNYLFWAMCGCLLWALAQQSDARDLVIPQTAEEIARSLSFKEPNQTKFTTRGSSKAAKSKMTTRGFARTDPTEYSPTHSMSSYQNEMAELPKAAVLIHFPYDSARIPRDSYALLDQYALTLRNDLYDASLIVAGHTDSVGSEAYNWELARRRAQSVKDYLVARGVDSHRLVVKSFGETFPVASNTNEEGRRLNRRSEFIRFE